MDITTHSYRSAAAVCVFFSYKNKTAVPGQQYTKIIETGLHSFPSSQNEKQTRMDGGISGRIEKIAVVFGTMFTWLGCLYYSVPPCVMGLKTNVGRQKKMFTPDLVRFCMYQVYTIRSICFICVLRLSLGRRSVDLLPVAQRTNTLTYDYELAHSSTIRTCFREQNVFWN